MESSSCPNQVKKCCLLTQCHHFFSTTKILRALIPLYKLGLLFLSLNLACENIRFSSLFTTGDVSDEERGETDVFAGYIKPTMFQE